MVTKMQKKRLSEFLDFRILDLFGSVRKFTFIITASIKL